MTREELQAILLMNPEDLIKALQISTYSIPEWATLEKQYNPKKHSINDRAKYPPKLNENNQDDFKRTALALQKLAVNRVAQSMFSIPVERKFNSPDMTDAHREAIEAFEELYRTENSIDSENIERAKTLNKSCQMATVWSAYESETKIKGQTSRLKLVHNTYAEPDGYVLFPIADQYGELLVLSISYTDSAKVEHFDIYINGSPDKSAYYAFEKLENWTLNAEISNTDIPVFPVVYTWLPEPVWGGDDGTNLVEQLEEMESYQGLYIKRNALPTFTLDYGDTTGRKKKDSATESSSDARRIIKVGKGGAMTDVTWDGAAEATENRYQRIRNAYFEQIQVPDTSFANMVKSNTSAENKELIFADAKAKAKDLGGRWEKMFLQEVKVVIAFMSIMYPKWAKQLEEMSVRSVIRPYTIRTKKENAEYINLGSEAMSLETKVELLDEADDVQTEVGLIKQEQSSNANQGI
jgi:hypothetical protein